VYTFRSLGDVVVKGKSKPVAIFEVLGHGEGAVSIDPRAKPKEQSIEHPAKPAGPAGIPSEAHV
jgi:hypothetical protein